MAGWGKRRQHVLFSYESEEPAIRQSYLDLQLQTKETHGKNSEESDLAASSSMKYSGRNEQFS